MLDTCLLYWEVIADAPLGAHMSFGNRLRFALTGFNSLVCETLHRCEATYGAVVIDASVQCILRNAVCEAH